MRWTWGLRLAAGGLAALCTLTGAAAAGGAADANGPDRSSKVAAHRVKDGRAQAGKAQQRHQWTAAQRRAMAAYGRLPIAFEENRGQLHRSVRFAARTDGYDMFLTDRETVFRLRAPAKGAEARSSRGPGGLPALLGAAKKGKKADAKAMARAMRKAAAPTPTRTAVLRLRPVAGSAYAQVSGAKRLPGRVTYLTGKRAAGWHRNIATYSRTRTAGVWPGVDQIWYGTRHGLKYDLNLAPGVKTAGVRFDLLGARNLRIGRHDELVISTAVGTLRQQAPIAWQRTPDGRRSVPVRFALLGKNRLGFVLGAHDSKLAVVIDPTLDWSSPLGGTGDDVGYSIAVDNTGAAYITGRTSSADFPTTATPAQGTYGTGQDAFVAKINPAGTALAYSTYLGGQGQDFGLGIAVDGTGAAYVTGGTIGTSSTVDDFPTTTGAYQTTFGGGVIDGFVAKLDSAGSSLAYSTYLGGAGFDEGVGIAVDGDGAAYVTGLTTGDFPTTANAPQITYGGGGGTDAFVAKINPTGTAPLVYATYLGGTGTDLGHSIAVGRDGAAYVAGATTGDFPTTANALQITYGGGGADAFVVKVNPTGTAPLVYASYLGGTGLDVGLGVAVGRDGAAYVAGATSGDFPTTTGSPQPTFGGGTGTNDAFVAMVKPDGTGLDYATYLGGTGDDYALGIALDGTGAAYVTGYTTGNFPVVGAVQSTFGGGTSDAFVAKIDPSGSAPLVYSTYLGGSGDENNLGGPLALGAGIAVDCTGAAYLTGSTTGGFPTGSSPLPSHPAGNTDLDAFVAKIPGSGAGCAATGGSQRTGPAPDKPTGHYSSRCAHGTGPGSSNDPGPC